MVDEADHSSTHMSVSLSELTPAVKKEACDILPECKMEFIQEKCPPMEPAPENFPCKFSGADFVTEFCVDINCVEVNTTCTFFCPKEWQENHMDNCMLNPSFKGLGDLKGRVGSQVAVPNSLPWQVAIVTKACQVAT